jgi:transcriptional regulator
MYLPQQNEETRIEVLHQMINTYPLGTLVVLGEEGLVANSIPFLLDSNSSPNGVLMGHVAKANPIWQFNQTEVSSLVCFQGAQNYISPSWYVSKQHHSMVVPTWNYVVVQAYGHPRYIHDGHWLYQHLTQLTNQHEANQPLPWKIEDAPKEYIDRLMGAIVGIEIPILNIQGKWKISQNRSVDDQLSVANELLKKENDNSQVMANLIQANILNTKNK